MRLVQVLWRDSGMEHGQGWKTAPQVENRTPLVSSVGYVMHEDDEFITIAMGYCPDEDMWYGADTIWKPSIKSVFDHSLAVKEAASGGV